VKAGSAYFALVFGIGFILGTIRVLVVAPRLGDLVAVLIELPIILTAAWIICDRVSARFLVPDRWRSRFVMGGIAFALLMVAELGLSVLLFGNSIGEHLGAYRSSHGALGLTGQLIFALFPLVQLSRGG
jgi:hypothetical protein